MISFFSRKHPLLFALRVAPLLLGCGQIAQAALKPGEIILGEMNCAACHEPSPAVAQRLASAPSPRLGRMGAHLSPAWVRDFLASPQTEAPGTRMPDMLHALPAAEKADAAEALTHYLISLQDRDTNANPAFVAAISNHGKQLFHEVGCVACHAPQEFPSASGTESRNQSDLAELAKNSVPLGNLAKKFSEQGLVVFLLNPLKSRPSGRMPAQHLTTPEAEAVAMYLLRDQARQPDEPFTVDNAKAARGKELFAKLNCASCHQIDQPGTKAAPLDRLAPSEKGCLAPDPPANAPRFSFTDAQRNELLAVLANISSLAQPLSPPDQVHRTMTALNCYACHSRDGQGSPTGLRREYFKASGQVDLGEEGMIPPHLNGVGAKLKPRWLEQVLFTGASVRPYMATRMPQFGEANVRPLVAAFEQADAGRRSGPGLTVDPASVKNGQRLVGTEGLSCVSCHGFAGHQSLGVPAIDLATAHERLNSDWFRRYLLDPASLRPGTRMPSFWPDGVAANKAIFNGDTEKQISAVWSYLADGRAAPLPPGLIPARMELVASTEPVIYRNFIEGAGSRAIGVGYPEKLDLAFDANQMCVALLWQGSFIDASHHRSRRGEGYQPPMGYDQVKFTPGAPFARLKDPAEAWPKTTGKTAGYQFRGYVFDTQRRPAFRYQFSQIDVRDFFLPVKSAGDTDPAFRRALSLHAAQPVTGLWFRAAVADKVEDKGNGAFVLNGRIHLAFSAAQPVLRTSEGKSELLVPVVFQNGEAEIVEEISW